MIIFDKIIQIVFQFLLRQEEFKFLMIIEASCMSNKPLKITH